MKARKLPKKGKSKRRKWIKEKSIAISQKLPVMQLIVLLQERRYQMTVTLWRRCY
jgi:hypothetical protein